MPNPAREPAGDSPEIAAAVKAALEDLVGAVGDAAPGEAGDAAPGEAPNLHWLGLGLRLGLERPERARQLLHALEAPARAADDEASTQAQDEADVVPMRSRLLASSALAPSAGKADIDADIVFGWAARLSPREILAIGSAVEQMLTNGAPADVARGFGLAWRAGAKIPPKSLDAMMSEFTQLELVVASVLGGHDLAAAAREEPKGGSGLGGLGLLAGFRRNSSSALRDADVVLQQRGKPASLGLVALWNAWSAVRYRELIPAATYDLLVQPWIGVVGRLP